MGEGKRLKADDPAKRAKRRAIAERALS